MWFAYGLYVALDEPLEHSSRQCTAAMSSAPPHAFGATPMKQAMLVQSYLDFSQARLYSASSCQPLSITREWPRPANSLYSVTACERA